MNRSWEREIDKRYVRGPQSNKNQSKNSATRCALDELPRDNVAKKEQLSVVVHRRYISSSSSTEGSNSAISSTPTNLPTDDDDDKTKVERQ